MHVAVVGVGYLGARVLARLEPAAASAYNRSPRSRLAVPVQSLDLDRDIAGLALPDPCALLYTVPPAAEADGDPRLERLLSALIAPPRRVVYVSTSGVYGHRGGAAVDEDAVPAPATPRARRRLAAEQWLAAWCRSSGSECFILRAPGIYGPGRLGLDRIRRGEPLIRPEDANPGNRIHIDDLAGAALAALRDAAPPGIYNIGDGDHRSSTWFTGTVARLAGLAAPTLICRAEAERSLSPGRLSFLAESRRLDTRRMRQVLGFTPRYADAVDGIRASLEEERITPAA